MQANINRKRRKKVTKIQPPDAENRMSGGVGGMTGAIPSSPPDRGYPGYVIHHEDTKDTKFYKKLSGNAFLPDILASAGGKPGRSGLGDSRNPTFTRKRHK